MRNQITTILIVSLLIFISSNLKATPEDSLRVKQIGKSIYIVHKVDSKETLYSIAQRYKVTEQSILDNNTQIKDAAMVHANDFLMIPYQEAKTLTSAEDSESFQIKHEVVKNDNLTQIAKRYGVSVAELMKWNDLPNDKIKLGQQLIVGIGVRKSTVKNNPNSTYVASKNLKEGYPSDSTVLSYKVVKGDNLTKIAQKFSVSVEELEKWNNLKDDDILVGQVLKIKEDNKTDNNTFTQIVYKVNKGDIIGKIASDYSVSIADICKWNKLDPKNPVIITDSKLNLFPFGKKEGAKANVLDGKDVRVYTVQKGQGLRVIATEFFDYGVDVEKIKQWNNMVGNDLFIGQKLLIYLNKKDDAKVITSSNPVADKINSTVPAINCEDGNTFVSYTVVQGDVIANIAKKYSVKYADIKAWNKKENDNLKIGEVLYLCSPLPPTAIARINQTKPQFTKEEQTYKPEYYFVESGDNLTNITKKLNDKGYVFTVSDLGRWNSDRLENNHSLDLGDTLVYLPIKTAIQANNTDNNTTLNRGNNPDPFNSVKNANSGNGLFNANTTNPNTVNTNTATNPVNNNTVQNPLFGDPTQTNNNANQSTNNGKVNNNANLTTNVNQNLTSGGNADTVKNTTNNENAMKEIVNIQGTTKVVKTGYAEMIEGSTSQKFEALMQGGPLKEVIMVKNLENGKTIYARVVGVLEEGSATNGAILKLSEKAYRQLSSGNGKISVEISYTAK